MKLIIDIDENILNDAKSGYRRLTEIADTVVSGVPFSTTLKQIREEIKSTYYSQGAGFDDFPHGFICAKDEDMKIIDKYIQKADMGGGTEE